MTTHARRVVITAASVVVLFAGEASAAPKKGGSAAAAAKAACIAAHEDAQALRTSKKPHAAREKFVACARAECPTVVRKECVSQLADVEREAPTVALEAHDETGSDTTAVKVTIDGTLAAERLTGSAVDVEPGEHLFRFERADGTAIEQRVLVVEGDKNKKVLADFATLVKPTVADAPRAKPEARKVPLASFVLGGVAVVGLGAFTAFAVAGKGQEHDLRDSCGTRCTDDQLSPVKRDYLIADISLVVAIASAATAVVLAWPAITGGSPRSAAANVATTPAPWMPRVKVRALP